MTTATIEIGNNDSIVITHNGKAIGFVRVREIRGNGHVELVGAPINFNNYEYTMDKHTYNSFACTGTISCDTPEEMATADNFIAAWNA